MQNLMINFSIPKPLLQTVDGLAEEEMKTRSEFLRDAIRDYLKKKLTLKKRWEAVLDFGKKKASLLKIKSSQVEPLVESYRKNISK